MEKEFREYSFPLHMRIVDYGSLETEQQAPRAGFSGRKLGSAI